MLDYAEWPLSAAGPAGLLLGLLLAQHDIEVEILEMLDTIDPRPRGAAYGPPAISVLRRAGVVDDIRQRGLEHNTLSWRRLDGSIIHQLTGLKKNGDTAGYLLLPVYDLACLLYEKLSQLPKAKVHFGHKVMSIHQDDASAWAACENGRTFKADFIVGCDGGSSFVRKSLFGNNFPGKTWDPVIVATNIHYDFAKYGYEDTSWIIDPEHWAVVAHIAQDGTWRVSYGEVSGLSHEELRERMPEKLRLILPGHPTPDQYILGRFSPYTLHQRCAEHMRVGRVLLAADAAHLNNPMGGLGLTGGISDVGGLFDCLYGIYEGKADLQILDEYDRLRRKIFWTVANPISTLNLERIRKDPAELVGSEDVLFKQLEEAKTDPSIFSELKKPDMTLLSDFTRFYKPDVPNCQKLTTQWNRLIRYISAKTGQVRYGEPMVGTSADIDELAAKGTLRAKVLEGSSWLTVKSTGEEDRVETLLAPLTPTDVPIIRYTGLNYRSHIVESNFDNPKNPTLFIKSRKAVGDTCAPTVVPRILQAMCDYEGELTIVIGKDAKNVREEDALDYVAGYMVGNDVSCRDWQLEKDKAGMMPQWCFAKSFDGYAPIGPAIVSTTVLGDAKGLRLRTYVNGEIRQDSDTSDLLFGVKHLVSFYSMGTTLEKGSLIMTGTPNGVGAAMSPPQFLKDGDEVVVDIEGIGKLRNRISFE